MHTGRNGTMGMILIGLAAASLTTQPLPDPSELDRQADVIKSGIDVSHTAALLQRTIGTPSDVQLRVSTNSFSPEVTAELRALHERLGNQLEKLEKAQRVEE